MRDGRTPVDVDLSFLQILRLHFGLSDLLVDPRKAVFELRFFVEIDERALLLLANTLYGGGSVLHLRDLHLFGPDVVL